MTARGTHPVGTGWHRAVAPDRRIGRLVVLCVLLVASLTLLAPAPAAGQEPAMPPREAGQVLAAAVHPFTANGSRTVTDPVPLVEVFTATWCPPCAPADRALDRLLDEQSPALAADGNASDIGLAVLQYHPVPDPDGEDPFGVPEGMSRMTRKYGAFWFPSVYVQGVMEDAPETRSRTADEGMEQIAYNGYGNLIRRAGAMEHPFVLTTTATVSGQNVTVSVHVEATAPVTETLYLQGALWQDHVFFRGSNGIDTHRMTVLGMSERRIDVDGLAAGEVWTTSWTVPLPAGMDVDASGMTVFVETAWDGRGGDESQALMGMAIGTAGMAATMILLLRRRDRMKRMTRTAGDAGDAGAET